MKFKGIKSTGYKKLAAYHSWLKDADRAALPTDFQGMVEVANSYAQQMEQVGLPISDSFWDYYKDFTYASQIDDINYMKTNLGLMAKNVPKIMQDLERYTTESAPPTLEPKVQPDTMTSVKPWSINGLTFEKIQEGIDQAVARWNETVNTQAVDPYSYFWDDVAAANEAIQWENYDAALELYNKITKFEDNYPEAQKIPATEAEGLNFDFLKGGKARVAIPMSRRTPKPRKDRTLSLLEEILGKPVKSLYDEDGDISDVGESWDDQDMDFGKSPSKGIDEKVFDVEVEDEPEVEDEFVPEVKKQVDPFEM